MLRRRVAPFVFVSVALLLVMALAMPAEATPQFDAITIADSAADERDPAAAFNPVSNEWHVVYQSGETSFYRDVSANGQTMESAVNFDPVNGGARNPLVAVRPDGTSLYPFYDLRFDQPPNPLSPSHDIPEGEHGDGSYGYRGPNAPSFNGQLPLANGPGLQSPKCIASNTAASNIFYVQRMNANDPVRLFSRIVSGNNIPSGSPIAVSSGMTNTEHIDCTYIDALYLVAYLETANVLIGLVNDTGLVDVNMVRDLQEDIADLAVATLITVDPNLAMAYVIAGPQVASRLAFEALDEAAYHPAELMSGDAAADVVTVRDVNDPDNPDIACYNGEAARCLIVWQETGTEGQRDIWGAFFANATVGAPFPIANTAQEERDPYVAASPNNTFLVLWNEGDGDSRDVLGALIAEAPEATATPTVTPTSDAAATATPTATPEGTPGVGPSTFLPLIRK